jgi:hypothetical protein
MEKKSCIDCIYVGHNGLGHRICCAPLPPWLNGKMRVIICSDENYKDPENNWRNNLQPVSRAEECPVFVVKTDIVKQKKYEKELQELRDEEVAHNIKFNHLEWVATKQY